MDLFDVAIAKKMSGGGGGNPNKVTTYAGTAADPFNGLSYEKQVEIANALYHGNATMNVTFALGGNTVTMSFTSPEGTVDINGRYCNGTFSSDDLFALYVEWHTSISGIGVFQLDVAQGSSGAYTVTDYRSMAGSIATQTTIIWHPLP